MYADKLTEKYGLMIESFECDFALALEGAKTLDGLQTALENKNEKLLGDIELLEELSFLLRYGKAKIVPVES